MPLEFLNSSISDQVLVNAFGGAALGSLLAIGIILLLIVTLAVYVYTALVLQTLARKFKHKHSWLAWIPIVNLVLILNFGNFHWAWIFLVLLTFIPFVGWIPLTVVVIIASWRMFQKLHYPGWFALAPIIPLGIGMILYLIALGFAAWKPRKK